VPPCTLAGTPPAKAVPKAIEKRERYYTRFLQAVMRSEELKNSQFLLDFLFEQDSKAFAKLQKDVEKFGQTRGPSRLDEYLTASGLASV
jgi:hypothetical protein